MKTKTSAALFSLIVLSFSAFALYCRGDEQTAHLHAADVPVSALQHMSTDPVTAFPETFALQVAVFRTSTDEGMLGLLHAFGEMGIPFFVTRDLDQALRHRLVILYPTIDARTFSLGDLEKLHKHVSMGGSLISFNVLAGALKPLFGYRDVAPSRRRHRVIFNATADAVERYLNRPGEREIQLGNPKYDEIFWTN
ncbi:MAG: hypothetical protein JO119_06230, partial [Acidobacteria bacterium]|nr:hypothetical protein [Acidobacteriota bacterium]